MEGDVLFEPAGALRTAYDAVDWAATPLGPVSGWSPALRNAVDLALQTEFPVTLLWGPEFVLLYNARYVELIDDKHPAALGARARDVFPEAWDLIGPMMQAVRAGAGANWAEDEPVPLMRHGLLREAYFTFSYSPVRGPDGAIEGVMDIATETTRQVIDRRRLELLNALRELLADLDEEDEVAALALPLLRSAAADLPQSSSSPRIPRGHRAWRSGRRTASCALRPGRARPGRPAAGAGAPPQRAARARRRVPRLPAAHRVVAGAGARPHRRPRRGARHDAGHAAQPAHAAAAARQGWRSPSATGRRRSSRTSAATGTTPSAGPTGC